MLRRIKRPALATALIVLILPFARGDDPLGITPDDSEAPKRVVKTDAEWARILTHDQFMVTRRKATEPPFSGRYVNNHARGTYACVCCDAPLFASQAKFESGTGWPSYWRPVAAGAIAEQADYSEAEPRVEVMCRTCGAHLGHVFSDGPPPTGLRYCINSVALKFHGDPSAAATQKPKSSRPKSKPAPKPKADTDSKTKSQ